MSKKTIKIAGWVMFARAYLGGAIVTHLQYQQPIAMTVIIQIALWITDFFRFPELKQRLLIVKNQ